MQKFEKTLNFSYSRPQLQWTLAIEGSTKTHQMSNRK